MALITLSCPEKFIDDVAHSKDKTYAISEGAVHAGTPCADCTRVILNNPNLPTAEANAYWTDPKGMAHWKGLSTLWPNG